MNEQNVTMDNVQETTPDTVNQAPPAVSGYDFTLGTGNAAAPAFTSLDVTTPAGRRMLYKMTNRPDHNISDYINKDIAVTGIYVDVNPHKNTDPHSDNYGVVEDKPRTVLVDANGETYISGVSIGVFQAVREILRIFGHPNTWTEPLIVRPVMVKTQRGNMLTLEVV